MVHLEKQPWIETPLIESAALSKTAGCRVFLKLELLQPSGSFKSRGIGNLIRNALLDSTNNNKHLHFYSSSGGNAGMAAVIAARDLGCPCTVVVPQSTKSLMIKKLQEAGATEVIQYGESWFEADTYLRGNFIDNQNVTVENGTQKPDGVTREKINIYVPPFDHPDIWEGVGTMIPEIARQLPPREHPNSVFPADVVVCSVGGGGLFNGVVAGLDQYLRCQDDDTPQGKEVNILAAETQGTHSLAHSLRHGSLLPLPAITSLATSLGALQVAPQTFENAHSPPAGLNTVSVVGSDAEAARGVVRLADEFRLQVELACGISVEVGSSGKLKEMITGLTPESRVVIVVCGGSNITAEMIAEYRQRLQDGWS